MEYSRAVIGIVAGLLVPGFVIVTVFLLITFKKELKLEQFFKKCCCRNRGIMADKRQATENPYILDNRGFLGRQPAVLSDDVELATFADMAILRQSIRQSIHERENGTQNNRESGTAQQSTANATTTGSNTNSSQANSVENSQRSTQRHQLRNGKPPPLAIQVRGPVPPQRKKNIKDVASCSVECENVNGPKNIRLPVRNRPNTIIGNVIDSSDDEESDSNKRCSLRLPMRRPQTMFDKSVDSSNDDSDCPHEEDVECSISDLTGDNVRQESFECSITDELVTLDHDAILEENIEYSMNDESETLDHDAILEENIEYSMNDESEIHFDYVNAGRTRANRPLSHSPYDYDNVELVQVTKRHTCLGISSPGDHQDDIYVNQIVSREPGDHQDDIYVNQIVSREPALSQVYENVTMGPLMNDKWDSRDPSYAGHIQRSIPDLDNLAEVKADSPSTSFDSEEALLVAEPLKSIV